MKEEAIPQHATEGDTFDPFVTAMWRAHRQDAPEQEMAGNPRKWIWKDGKGTWVDNPKPEPESAKSGDEF